MDDNSGDDSDDDDVERRKLNSEQGAAGYRASWDEEEEANCPEILPEESDEQDVSLSFVQHLEFVYELNHKEKFCYGPVLDLGFEKEGFHYMIGFHVGIIFKKK